MQISISNPDNLRTVDYRTIKPLQDSNDGESSGKGETQCPSQEPYALHDNTYTYWADCQNCGHHQDAYETVELSNIKLCGVIGNLDCKCVDVTPEPRHPSGIR